MANIVTKRALSAALKTLLSQKTLDLITVQEIADEAYVSRKTFYYHFQDIYDLLRWTLAMDLEPTMRAALEKEHWETSIDDLFHFLRENSALFLNAYHSSCFDALVEELQRVMSDWMMQSVDAFDDLSALPPEERAFLISTFTDVASSHVFRWLRSDMQDPESELAAQLKHFYRFQAIDLRKRWEETTA